MNTVVSTTVFRPAYRPATKNANALGRSFEQNRPQFQGQPKSALESKVKETSKVVQSLFDRPGKNMLWSVGYGLGGLLLIPMMPIAVGAFCLAGVHLVSASYQFLNDKPDEASENAASEQGKSQDSAGKQQAKNLSINA